MPEPAWHVRVNAPIGSLQVDASFRVSSPWTVLFGPSGSGKSSLLRLIAGLWQPKNSAVRCNDEDVTHVPPHRRRIAMVAQRPALFPHMDARSNVAFALGKQSQGMDRAADLLRRFHAEHVALQKPMALSGGETQRVALARAIASAPRLLLLDEIFSGMNRQLQGELIDELKRWQAETGTPILSVTHDVAEALDSASETLRIEDGKIITQGPTGEVLAAERSALLERLR